MAWGQTPQAPPAHTGFWPGFYGGVVGRGYDTSVQNSGGGFLSNFGSGVGAGLHNIPSGIGGIAGWLMSRLGLTPSSTGIDTSTALRNTTASGNDVANPMGVGTRLPTGIMGAGQSNALQMGTKSEIMKRNLL